jgi:MFS family permease
MSIAAWLIGIPLSSLFRHKPEQYGYLPDGETREATTEPVNVPSLHSSGKIAEQDSSSSVTGFTAKAALRTRAFWLLAFVFFFQHIAVGAVNVHIVPYLESVNIPTTIAATVVTGLTLSSLIGRLGFGFLGDFTNKRYLIATAVTLQTVGLFIFSFIDEDKAWLIIPFLLSYAPGYGGPIPLRAAMLADYFGRRSFGTILGWLALIMMFGGVASPVIAGWVFDVFGNYRLAWQAIGLITVPAIPLILLVRPPKS